MAPHGGRRRFPFAHARNAPEVDLLVDALLNAPVLVRVLGALAAILVLSRFTHHLVVAVGLATVLLAAWSGHSAPAAFGIAWERVSSPGNLLLLLIVFQVIWLSSQMSATNVMRDLVAAVRARVSRRTSMAVLPAVIGLLPMPGGALFSAPMVDSVDTDSSVSPALKAQTNHWFRHVWEYWWPLYPGVLLAMDISRMEVWQFMLLQFPLTLGAIASGYLFLLRRIHTGPSDGASKEERTARPALLPLLMPIIVVVVVYALVRVGHRGVQAWRPGVPPLNKYVPMVVGLFAAMVVLQVERPLRWADWRKLLFSRRAVVMALIVVAVRIYSAFIEADLPSGTPLVDQMRTELSAWGIPLMGIVIVLPLVSGLATGLAIGFVGASFPIVINLLADAPPGTLYATVVLAYGFGYMGMLVSPVHVCLVVTSQHFRTELLRNVAGLAKPAAFVLAWVMAWHWLVGWLIG
jgi:hypothetical protein